MIDVGRTRQDRGDEGEHLAPGEGDTDAPGEAHHLIHEPFEAEAHHERRGHGSVRACDERRLVADHPDPLERARLRAHGKCLHDLEWIRAR